MSHENSRKVFLVVAGGNTSAEKHFEDTLQRKRNLEEVRRFLPPQEIENLERIYHGSSFIVWGAVPGPMNESRWEKMTPGDVVLFHPSMLHGGSPTHPGMRRRTLTLRFFEELSVEETATAMGCAAGTVKATVHQALRTLREKMKQSI